MNPVERVLSALEARQLSVRGSDDRGYMAQCPAHDDRQPSLSIAVSDDGTVLLRCHAGCQVADVLGALGLQLADLFPPKQRDDKTTRSRRQASPAPLPDGRQLSEWEARVARSDRLLARLGELRGWTPEALNALHVGYDGERLVFPVRDRVGELVSVCRYTPSPRDGERKMKSKPAGRPRDLFPAPETIDGDEIWIVEGEPDAVAAHSLGLPAVGLPGVEFAKRLNAARFTRFGRVVVLLDCDQPGRDAAGALAAKLAGAGADVRVLDLEPSRTDGYDLGDYVREASEDGSSGLAQARELLERMAASLAPVSAPSTHSARPVDNGDGLTVRVADLTRAAPPRWAWTDRIVLGYLNLLLGNEGIGKGTLVAWLIARLTHGDLPGDLRSQPVDVGVLGDEDSFDDVWTPRLHAAGADLTRVVQIERPDGGFVNVREDRERLGREVKARGLRVLFFDQLLDNLGVGVDDWRQKAVRDSLQPLRALARELDIAALGALHPNKRADSFRQLVAGAPAFNAVSRSSLLLAQHPDDESLRVLVRGKGNLSKAPESIEFQIAEHRFSANGHDFRVPLAEGFHVGELTVDDLVGDGGTTAERSERDEATEFLLAEMADAPQDARRLIRDAPCSERTLRDAKKALRVESFKDTFSGAWSWRLPESTKAATTKAATPLYAALQPSQNAREYGGLEGSTQAKAAKAATDNAREQIEAARNGKPDAGAGLDAEMERLQAKLGEDTERAA